MSWVSLIVSSFKRKRSFNSPTEKCLSTSSSSSTTQLLSAFLWACRWKIFSSIVPVYKGKKNCPEHESDSGANGCLFYTCSRSLILGHILVNNQGKRGQKWELGREKRRSVLLCLFFFPLLPEFAPRSFPSSPTGTTCLFSSTLFKVRAPFPSLGTVCGGGRESVSIHFTIAFIQTERRATNLILSVYGTLARDRKRSPVKNLPE